jgi:single-stranded DNA-specific DHH superfamily exonuclease
VKALQWLLAGDVRAGELFQEIEHLNEERKEATISYLEDALHTADPADGILFYDSPTIEHGVI